MSTSEKEATMIYIKIDNDLFYDDAVVLVRSFYPRTEVTALKQIPSQKMMTRLLQ